VNTVQLRRDGGPVLPPVFWPFASRGLTSRLPAYLAAAIGFALLWTIAGLIFLRWPPAPSWRFGHWIAGAVLGGIACAVPTLLLPGH
jgi:hypothetical protein